MYEDLLPCGSIVKLSEGDHYVMICGRVVLADGNDHIFDYAGCFYPEGMSGSDNTLFFDRAAIESILFIGFQDKQELDYREEVLGTLGELKAADGKITEA
ncbi:MAG: DUF4176 domain-containing protein [Lachnospiraceae bacterium]|nr:DUF4176 domain-containing protein [Lachnospiraceae bacterium]